MLPLVLNTGSKSDCSREGIESVTGLDGRSPLSPQYYSLPEFDVEIAFGANDFVQVNGQVNRRMVAAAIDLLEVGDKHAVLDLYCGIGNFSLPLARQAATVLGIEVASQQVARAEGNAQRNAIRNCAFLCADLDAIDTRNHWLAQRWDRLLLDPARSGANAVVQHMDRIGPARIVYVSCHPGTLARGRRHPGAGTGLCPGSRRDYRHVSTHGARRVACFVPESINRSISYSGQSRRERAPVRARTS